MAHRQLLQVAVWAVCLASTGGAFAEPPPGSEVPTEYGEAEVETVIVIGSNYRCPDGTIVAALVECPAFQVFWWDTFFFVTLNSHGIIPRYQPDASACGSTPDANCACGSGKVKVYDDGNDTFHCRVKPPDAGCPLWGQTFDFDLKVWKCVGMPLDNSSANKIKNCLSSTVVGTYWDSSKIVFVSGKPWHALTTLDSNGSFVRMEINLGIHNTSCTGCPNNATPWHELADTLIHEFIHVADGALLGTNQLPATFNMTLLEYEQFTADEAIDVYESAFGVLSPKSPGYKPADHGALSCAIH